MFGSFSIEYDGKSINDQNNRMRKVWLLLAYLIWNRNHSITQEHYLSLLQGIGADESADPHGKLKALFYRARTMLGQLGDSLGHDLILLKNKTYTWNNEFPLTLDVEEFEILCKQASEGSDEERLALYRQALPLYTGDFLSQLGSDVWVLPISTYYHQLYIDTVLHALDLMEKKELWDEAASLCEAAIKIEPYNEPLYQHLIRSRIATDNRAAAIQIYEQMSQLLFDTFGVMPSDQSRDLYREASRQKDSPSIMAGTLSEQLREPFGAHGAMYCEYDFFRTLYQLQARTIVRSGQVIHIALFSAHGKNNEELPRRSLDRAMENLQDILVNNLRQGDVVTRCSLSQLVIMLPQSNYEDSSKVCQRLVKSFYRQYPHSPADIQFSIQPLEPKNS